MVLTIADGSAWHFEHGIWKDGEDGIIEPADHWKENAEEGLQGYRFAFHLKEAYQDVKARFAFLQKGHSEIGLIFRAKDASNFYVLHFPCCGQAFRAQHFWIALSEMDDSGYLRIIKREMVNRINSLSNIWHTVELHVQGSELHATIDGTAHFRASGLKRGAGYAGAMNFNEARIRNVHIKGVADHTIPWNNRKAQSTNWIYPCTSDVIGTWQMPTSLVRTSAGDLLLYFSVDQYSDNAHRYVTRSSDHGRTWSKPHLWWKNNNKTDEQHRHLHVFPDGTLKCAMIAGGLSKLELMESRDGGHSWSDPVVAVLPPLPGSVQSLHIQESGPGAFINLMDGSVLMIAYGGIHEKMADVDIFTWGAHHCQAFVSRSTDGGYTWSEFTNIDGITDPANGNPVSGNMDLTEVCGVQTGDGSIMAFVRPIYSPWMWEARSNDGGKTWEPCVIGAFPGYATPNMVRTQSGYLVVAHRLPGLTLDVSLDDGKTWTHAATIDSAIWAMGCMLEVEPDVILYIYWDSFHTNMRAQWIKITHEGMIPTHL